MCILATSCERCNCTNTSHMSVSQRLLLDVTQIKITSLSYNVETCCVPTTWQVDKWLSCGQYDWVRPVAKYTSPATGCYPEPHAPSTSLPPPSSLAVLNAFPTLTPTLFPQSVIPWQTAGYRSSCHVQRNGHSAKVIRNSISLFTNKVHYLSINTIIRLLTLHVWALLYHLQWVYWAMSPSTRQCTYKVTMRGVRESLLPWKNSITNWSACACMRVGACGYPGACACSCSLVNPACNAYAPYCDVICGPSVSTTFFDIIS